MTLLTALENAEASDTLALELAHCIIVCVEMRYICWDVFRRAALIAFVSSAVQSN